ncbi:YqgE/AlgH family protein [Archangium violaceum]|uniref:YqgE/AlgH family protein n=1 Tax=Archangium violaceum TaxID=83451 RepID=UPI00193C3923|nr:YqgE/AlgH family protein [Archangium violaceum]QRK08338.1 YqgE/AlgH family protein [Archangium violaceum]
MQTLAPGLLVAMPQLTDSNFRRSVILMLEHGESGSMGLIINRGASLTLGDLAKNQSLSIAPERTSQPVFMGGPVENHRGFLLHDNERVTEKHEVVPGLYLSLTLDTLGPLLKDPGVHLRFCLGYAGWGPNQLESELASGSWLYAEASARPVLEGDPGLLWDNTLKSMGVDPAMLLKGKGLN